MGLEFEAESVEIGSRFYFTAASCRAAVTAAREQASWLPAPGDDPAPSGVAVTGAGISFGGC